jgi:hypothetical protein
MSDPSERAQALAMEAEAQFRAGDLSTAAATFRVAISLQPTALRLHNLAAVRLLQGRHAEAEATLREALSLEPGERRVGGLLSLAILAQGRWAEGFRLYDPWCDAPEGARRTATELGAPLWAGEPVAGKRVLVWGEEGAGDQIMFARFAKLLQQEGAEVSWAANAGLTRLVREGLGQPATEIRNGMQIARPDYVAPTTVLPTIYMQRLAAPPEAPYLDPPAPNRVEGLRIGVMTEGNSEHVNNAYRSLPPEAAQALLALPGAVSLEPKITGARDFWDTAAVVTGLDLVISVDTAVAHLAGALGRPCWVLLPAVGCDWRWGASGQTSPWYPSLRLFRQWSPGDWAGVIAEVRQALATR